MRCALRQKHYAILGVFGQFFRKAKLKRETNAKESIAKKINQK
jgi:hypothetical protein